MQPEKREGKTVYDETDREIVRAANELSRVGVGARNLRVFRSSADREANLLEALLGPSLRSRNPERRKEALESLESLAATVSHLKHLLLVRDLRRLAGDRPPGPWPASPASAVEAPAADVWKLVSDPYNLPRWWPRTGGWRTWTARGRQAQPAGPRCWRPPRAGRAADFRCISSAEGERYVGSSRSRGLRSSATCAASRVEIELRRGDGGTEVSLPRSRS